MTKSNTQVIAKVAAVVAGLGLVLSSFAILAPVAGAQTTTTTSVTFTRDLTIGSTGADVTALQNWLISKGFSIPAGATGYFGTQTQAAVAAYQAANGITPAAGYFGPITRAKVNAGGSVSGGDDDDDDDNDDDDNDGDLSGGEADLSDFELVREEATGDEGEEEVAIATAEFDVEDGDVMVERLELIASSSSSTLSTRPWDYFDRIVLMADGDEIGEMDVDSRDAWDEEDDDIYRLSISDLDYQVNDGERAEITIAADIAGSIDTDDQEQEFVFQVPEDGIRAVDGDGIQQYIGADDTIDDSNASPDETVEFGFGAEESGDLQVRSNSDDPDATTLIADEDDESDEYTVFVFDIENDDEVDALITELAIGVTDNLGGTATDGIIRRATLVVGGDEFDGDVNNNEIVFEDMDLEIGSESEETFELMITLVRNAPSSTLRFDVVGEDDVEAEGVDSGDDAELSGSATSDTHTVATTGITVSDGSNETDVNDNQTIGTFRLEFTVDALEDDAYIYRGAGDGTGGTASTTGVRYVVYQDDAAHATTSDSATLQSSADIVTSGAGSYYVVRQGSSETFTLTVVIDPAGTGTHNYYVELDSILFDDDTTNNTTANDSTYTVPDEAEFETDTEALAGA